MLVDGRQAEVAPLRRDRHREPRDVEAALALRQLARLEAHDVRLVLGEDVGEPRHEAELVAAADGDPVGDPRQRGRVRVERVGHHPHLRAVELGQAAEPRLDLLRRDAVRQVADGGELGAAAERREGGVAQADAGAEQLVGDRRRRARSGPGKARRRGRRPWAMILVLGKRRETRWYGSGRSGQGGSTRPGQPRAPPSRTPAPARGCTLRESPPSEKLKEFPS